MKIVAIIPARMESSRFPGKPLKKILGMPMIGHVFKRSKLSNALDEVYVATCNKEIEKYISSIGGKVVMTKKSHERASDRTAEALDKIIKNENEDIDIVVMLQGDEPMIKPQMIDDAIKPLIDDNSVLVSNLISKIQTKKEWNDRNEVKVVFDNNFNALYFSREPIPSSSKFEKKIIPYKQVCVIPFRKETLFKYTKLSPTNLEIIESVDMNRLLEYGIKIKLIKTNEITFAVDTLDDLINVEQKMKGDPLLEKYQ